MFSLTSKMYSSVTGSRWKLLNCICLSDPFTDGNMLHPSGRLSCQLSFFSFRINWPHLIGECVLSLIHVQFSVTPWTVTCQAPLSLGFSRQEYWIRVPFPYPGIFPNQGWNPSLLHWQEDSLLLSHQGSLGVGVLLLNSKSQKWGPK